MGQIAIRIGLWFTFGNTKMAPRSSIDFTYFPGYWKQVPGTSPWTLPNGVQQIALLTIEEFNDLQPETIVYNIFGEKCAKEEVHGRDRVDLRQGRLGYGTLLVNLST